MLILIVGAIDEVPLPLVVVTFTIEECFSRQRAKSPRLQRVAQYDGKNLGSKKMKTIVPIDMFTRGFDALFFVASMEARHWGFSK